MKQEEEIIKTIWHKEGIKENGREKLMVGRKLSHHLVKLLDKCWWSRHWIQWSNTRHKKEENSFSLYRKTLKYL